MIGRLDAHLLSKTSIMFYERECRMKRSLLTYAAEPRGAEQLHSGGEKSYMCGVCKMRATDTDALLGRMIVLRI